MIHRHTQGPWALASAPEFEAYRIEAGGEDFCIGEVHAWEDAPEEAAANARLIASAPEMLGALKLLMTAHGKQLDLAFQTAQDAITKATGAPWPDA